MESVCFTGHRAVKITNTLKIKLFSTLETLIKNGAVNFYNGGALGWDMLCAETILSLKSFYPHIELRLVLPCLEQEQSQNWNSFQKERYQNIVNAADNIEFISQHYTNDCMKKRNARLVELSDCCVSYFNEKDYASGTGQTIRMAKSKGIRIIDLRETENDG